MIKILILAHTLYMLDNRKRLILSYVNSLTSNGYAVVTLNELRTEVLNVAGEDVSNVENDVRQLSSLGYIKLKFDDGLNFCLTCTEKGRSYVDIDEDNLKKQTAFNGYKSLIGVVVASSFIGAFSGAIITLVVLKLVGA